MAAYGALVSLVNTIYNIQNHSRLSTSLDKKQIESLGEKLDFFMDFVENHHSRRGDEEVEGLESQIASSAHAAEDVIESHIVDLIEEHMARSTFVYKDTRSSLLLDVLMHFILRIKNHPRLSTTSLDREQIESLGEKLDFLLDLIENPNSHASNEEAEALKRQIQSEALIVEDVLGFHRDQVTSFMAESTFHSPGTMSSILFDFYVVIMEQILNYPRLWTSLEGLRFTKIIEFLEDTKSSFNFLEDQMTFEAIVAEDVFESHEARSTYDQGESSSSSMIGLQKEINAMKEKVMKVREKICGKKVILAGSENSFLPDLQKILEDMHSLKERMIKIKDERGLNDLPSSCSMPAALSGSLTTGKANVVGLGSYSYQLLVWLKAEQSDQLIISITGMGGIGKTTLVRKVYDDLFVVQHFDVRAWLTISQVYNVRELLVHTLSRLGKSTKGLVDSTEDELGVLLYQFLCGRRYLIVLDDMWSIEAWDKIRFYFPREENRSRIVVTTRQSDVASHFGYLRIALDFLDDDKSWDLFCGKAFEQGCCPSELENIGRKIVKKCKGLPLSIVVIGGLLGKSSRTQQHWENVEKELSSIVNTADDNQCFNILSLSYSYLPAHLKPCFLYLGVFLEDHEIRVSQLIQLWVAEGFINPSKNPSLEEVGEGYIKDLVDRNLLSVRGLSTIGKVKTCSIHDLLRDLSIKVAEKEKFFCLVRELDTPQERRLILLEGIEKKYNPLQSTSLVRSVLSEVACHVTSNSRLLRVFSDAHSFGGFAETAFQHVNLRFLRCIPYPGGSWWLPPSISLLWNLQTLIIVGNHVEVIPPSEVWQLQQLRHLKCQRLSLVDCKPPVSDEQDQIVLRNLQTLQTAMVFKFSDEVCKRLPNIKKLVIYITKKLEHNCFFNICRLTKLESLRFSCREVPSNFGKNLRLPSSLRKLALTSCRIKCDDLTRIGSLPHLEVLKLDAMSVVGPEWNPIEGEFQRLKYLQISYCFDLRQWNADCCHFPVLEKLVIEELWELDEIPSGIGDIPTLRDIYLVECSVSAVMSAVSILKEQESYGNEVLQVRVKFRNEKKKEEVREKMELEGFSNNKFHMFQ